MPRFKSVDLTSPPHHGNHAAEAQHLLQDNRWHKMFYHGPLDGIYGEKSAAGTRHAKFFLGFPRAHVNGANGAIFGERLHGFLVGPKQPGHLKLPADYKARMKHRQHDLLVKRDWHDHVIQVARSHLHETEHPPNSNQTVFNQWYYGHMVAGPWCAMFASYCIQEAKGPTWFKYAYCPYILRDANAGLNGMHVTHAPGQGAVVLFDWNDDGVADHVELFVKWDTKGQSFQSIGGNTGPQDASNGGQVLQSQRFTSDVAAFIHVP